VYVAPTDEHVDLVAVVVGLVVECTLVVNEIVETVELGCLVVARNVVRQGVVVGEPVVVVVVVVRLVVVVVVLVVVVVVVVVGTGVVVVVVVVCDAPHGELDTRSRL